MIPAIEFFVNKASGADIIEHLRACDTDFDPPLSDRVKIDSYATKIVSKATRFEAWSGGTLVGLVVAYCNDQENHIAYITSVSVLKEWTGNGIAAQLMNRCVEYAKSSGMRQVDLQVASDNTSAIKLYRKSGFVFGAVDAPFVSMSLYLKGEAKHDY